MSSNTPNLGLLKKDPMMDGNETFNIETMLNENWDKVDEAVGQVREDLGNIDVDIPDASLTQKGIVQLSSATNGTRENVAATEKAVKAAYDEALAGKQLGVEQKANVVAALNSIGVSASTSETWAQLVTKMAGVIRATGNATAGDILAGKTASNVSGPITGGMPHLTGTRSATGTAKWPDGALVVYPEKGYQKGGSGDGEIKVSTAQLQAVEGHLTSNHILSGKTIFGVSGTLKPSVAGSTFISGSTPVLVSPNYSWDHILFELPSNPTCFTMGDFSTNHIRLTSDEAIYMEVYVVPHNGASETRIYGYTSTSWTINILSVDFKNNRWFFYHPGASPNFLSGLLSSNPAGTTWSIRVRFNNRSSVTRTCAVIKSTNGAWG